MRRTMKRHRREVVVGRRAVTLSSEHVTVCLTHFVVVVVVKMKTQFKFFFLSKNTN